MLKEAIGREWRGWRELAGMVLLFLQMKTQTNNDFLHDHRKS
jgi:type II secretory pathway component PulL